MAIDDPAAQLHAELRSAVAEALHTRRPILHHLNADTSWLLQLPRPGQDTAESGRLYFNILIDPWLQGGQSDGARWFSQQWHAIESKISTISAAETLLRGVERLAGGTPTDDGTYIDAVAISHEFTDHCHQETLLEVDPSVPVFATANAATLIQSWKHFDSVQTVPAFAGDWTQTSLAPLPNWIGISRITTAGNALYYHSALLLAFSGSGPAEAVIYSPHGIQASDLACIPKAKPALHTLAFLHGLHDVFLSKAQLNLGARNGLKAQRMLHARYWIGTHDEVKRGGGVVSFFLHRKAWTLREALDEERKGEEWEGKDPMDGTNWIELGNGESQILL
ncbi:hypothetical protein ANO11243_011260 [Dothideomycetidae sp. 11243]|nr:hypothetical protein ANO11243_011260 [fungal sp. No.11243]